MESNKFAFAGWLAVVQAIIFPIAFVMAIIEQGIAAGLLKIDRPFFGPSDVLMLIFTAIAIYVLLMFKRLLNEHYEYHDLNLLIYISIWWAIMFQVIGLGLGYLMIVLWPVDKVLFAVLYLVFFAGAMVAIGIVDILIAIKLLKIKEHFSELIRAFAYISMGAGICEVSVLLSPLSLVLVPVSAIVLAMIFFRDRHQVEYV
ncbi:MAG: hypothetical protein JSV52_13710 [Candidatus Zixiibacteriota bacterium]|nr:MAG: hypothetical protein JSV52_13710 [candidate division Zixibacteria bacterium]